MPADRIGPYRLLERVGRGGMGLVWKARHETGGETVVVKLLAPELAGDPLALARLEREAQAIGAVEHPGVTKTHGTGVHEGRPYLVMELVEGGSLEQRLERDGTLPWAEAAAIGSQVAAALAAVHAAGIVHRDLKPANILLDAQGRPKLADFGLVRLTKRGVSIASLTGTGELVGTLEYFSPEQADGTRPVEAPADVYALGIVLHALVAGEPPFQGETYAVMKAHLMAKPPPLRTLVPEVPEAFEALVLRLLSKDPAARGSADQVALELEALAHTRSSGGRRLGLLVALPLALVVLVVAWSLRPQPQPQPPAPPPTASPPATPPAPPKPTRGPPLTVRGFTPNPRLGEIGPTKLARLSFVHGNYNWARRAAPRALAVSPDGTGVATAELGGAIVLWDKDGNEKGVVGSHVDARLLAFSHDGKWLASASRDWLALHPLTPGPLAGEVAIQDEPRSICFAPDSRTLLVATRDGSLAKVDVESKQLSPVAPPLRPEVRETTSGHAPDGTRVIVAAGKIADVRDPLTGGAIKQLDCSQAVAGVAVAPRRNCALIGFANGFGLFDLEKGTRVLGYDPPQPPSGGTASFVPFELVNVFPDEAHAIAGSTGGTYMTLDLQNGKILHQGTKVLNDAVLLADGKTIVGLGENGIIVLDMTNGERVETGPIRSLALSGNDLLYGHTSALALVDTANRKSRWTLHSGPGGVIALALGTERIAVASATRIAVLDLGGASTKSFDARSLKAAAVTPDASRAFMTDGRLLAVSDSDRDKKPREVQGAHEKRLIALAIAADGERGAASDGDEVTTYDLAAGKRDPGAVRVPGATTLVFTKDGLLAGSESGAVTLISGGAIRSVLAPGSRPVQALAAHEGRALVALGDGTVRLLALDTGAELDRIDLEPARDAPTAVAFSSDGRSFLVGTACGIVLRFELD